jgi:hypothetical protein
MEYAKFFLSLPIIKLPSKSIALRLRRGLDRPRGAPYYHALPNPDAHKLRKQVLGVYRFKA